MNFHEIIAAINAFRGPTDTVDEAAIVAAIGADPSLATMELPKYVGFEETTSIAFEAATSGTLEVLKCLHRHGVDFNKKTGYWKSTILHAAAHNLQIEMVEYLLSIGVETDVREEDGHSVLYSASCLDLYQVFYRDDKQMASAAAKQIAIVDMLLKHNRDLLNQDKDMLFDAVANSGNVALLQYYLDKGLDNIEVKNEDGRTPICVAASEGNYNIFKYLFDMGAKLDVVDNNGMTLPHFAARSNNIEIVQELARAGLNMNIRDNMDRLPAYYLVGGGFAFVPTAKSILSLGIFEIDALVLANANEQARNHNWLEGIDSIVQSYLPADCIYDDSFNLSGIGVDIFE